MGSFEPNIAPLIDIPPMHLLEMIVYLHPAFMLSVMEDAPDDYYQRLIDLLIDSDIREDLLARHDEAVFRSALRTSTLLSRWINPQFIHELAYGSCYGLLLHAGPHAVVVGLNLD